MITSENTGTYQSIIDKASFDEILQGSGNLPGGEEENDDNNVEDECDINEFEEKNIGEDDGPFIDENDLQEIDLREDDAKDINWEKDEEDTDDKNI